MRVTLGSSGKINKVQPMINARGLVCKKGFDNSISYPSCKASLSFDCKSCKAA